MNLSEWLCSNFHIHFLDFGSYWNFESSVARKERVKLSCQDKILVSALYESPSILFQSGHDTIEYSNFSHSRPENGNSFTLLTIIVRTIEDTFLGCSKYSVCTQFTVSSHLRTHDESFPAVVRHGEICPVSEIPWKSFSNLHFSREFHQEG